MNLLPHGYFKITFFKSIETKKGGIIVKVLIIEYEYSLADSIEERLKFKKFQSNFNNSLV